jgi:beta-glucosidase
MSLERKCATMMHGTLTAGGNPMGLGAQYDFAANEAKIHSGITSFITRVSAPPRSMAQQSNTLQAIAERADLAIPLTISSDPRNQIGSRIGMSSDGAGFSTWPDPLGFAAIGDDALMRQFGQLAAAEYRAVGIQMALSPQANLATEPRWSRIDGTFGEDPALVSRMVAAYVEGFQGSRTGLTPTGVATVVKHWVGYGASKDGWDGHNYYGRYADFSGGAFEDHLVPFRAAFASGAAAVMPTYDILQGVEVQGKPLEPVGAGFNRQLLTQLLREQELFKGLVVSDWGITNDCPAACKGGWQPGTPPVVGMPWGVESLTREDRFAKAINAGVDQLGGTEEFAQLVSAVRAHKVPMRRIDEAVRRILTLKFQLGLFENPYVDEDAAGRIVGNPATQAKADAAQRAALVVLENRQAILPLKQGTKVALIGFAEGAGRDSGLTVVSRMDEADVVVIRADAPRHLEHPGYFFGAMQAEGPLDYRADDPVLLTILDAAKKRPTVLVVHLDRPAVLSQVKDAVGGLIGEFGIRDWLLLQAIADARGPVGRLPFEFPTSMEAVLAQKSSVSRDTAHQLYTFGHKMPW